MLYFTKIPYWLHYFFPSLYFKVNTTEKCIYLTFDDGPHPTITPWVLQILKQYNASATFFCVGNNVSLYPDTFKAILDSGCNVGNHSYNHINGFSSTTLNYVSNIEQANQCIDSTLFRPPYGKITLHQIRALKNKYKIILWSIISPDFDISLSPEKCWAILKNKKLKSGNIIVMHDSDKAKLRLEYVLPQFLHYATTQGFAIKHLPIDIQ